MRSIDMVLVTCGADFIGSHLVHALMAYGVLFLVPFIKSLASSVMAFAVLFIQSLWMNKYLLPLYITTGGIVYLLMLRLLGAVQKEDIELLHKPLPKRISLLASALKFVYMRRASWETPQRL